MLGTAFKVEQWSLIKFFRHLDLNGTWNNVRFAMNDLDTPASNIEQDLVTSTLIVGTSVNFKSLQSTPHWNVQFLVPGIVWHMVRLLYGTMYFAYNAPSVFFSSKMATFIISGEEKIYWIKQSKEIWKKNDIAKKIFNIYVFYVCLSSNWLHFSKYS